MADLEKVLKGLERCRKGFCFACPYNDGVDDNVDCKQKWADDALALLKEQEPRVLTLEEVQALQNNDVVWLEDKGKPKIIPGIVKSRQLWPHSVAMVTNFIRSDGCTVTGGDEDCGKRWRCWNKRPTDEQRKAVKWDD